MRENNSILLSAVVIAKDEANRIGVCLSSLSFAGEIIVVDNGSVDKTADIARRCGAKVVTHATKSFSDLRNKGKTEAQGTWILYVDADEEVSGPLQKEIETLIAQPIQASDPAAYYLTRENHYLGKKWPVRDKMQRLFLKKNLIRWIGTLHETAEIEGTIATLREPLIHTTHRTLEEMVAKTNEWSYVEAKLRFDAHHPPVVPWRLLRVMVTGFIRSFTTEGGWRMGTAGWIESIYQGFSMFITYAKLWEMQQQMRVKK